jgi:hypothetical protein
VARCIYVLGDKSATFLLLGKSPTPSDYAARAKSSVAANLFNAPKSTKLNSPLFTVAFAIIKFVRVNRAYIRTTPHILLTVSRSYFNPIISTLIVQCVYGGVAGYRPRVLSSV